MSADDRFWAKVQGGDFTECWLWTATTGDDGYGRFRLDGRIPRAHRVSYEWLIGEIPEGLQLDHLCRNTACVNPWHLEPVTGRVNTMRSTSISARYAARTHCGQGHPFAGDNLAYVQGTKRRCRKCHAIESNASYHRKKAGVA